jgi:RNA polymerase sigma-70 factor (ECF subfamily)
LTAKSNRDREKRAWPSTKISLLASIQRGADEQVWTRFVELYTPLLVRYCRLRGLQESDAEDVTQNVLAIVSRAIGGFDYDRQRGRFRSWLGTIAYREIQRHRAKAERAVRGTGDGIGDALIDQVDAGVDPCWLESFNAHVYHLAKNRIRPQFRDDTWQAFEMTWEQDRAPKEVARVLGKPAPWVYKAKYNVLRRLKEELAYLCEDAGIFQRR